MNDIEHKLQEKFRIYDLITDNRNIATMAMLKFLKPAEDIKETFKHYVVLEEIYE